MFFSMRPLFLLQLWFRLGFEVVRKSYPASLVLILLPMLEFCDVTSDLPAYQSASGLRRIVDCDELESCVRCWFRFSWHSCSESTT